MNVDVYPVGWLAALLGLWRTWTTTPGRWTADQIAAARRHAWVRLQGEAQLSIRLAGKREWRPLRNLFNGYLAEPDEFPAGDYRRRCGTGWTKRRALRSLHRRLPSGTTGS